jgi:hypothetical protein
MAGRLVDRIGMGSRIVDDPGFALSQPDPVDPPVRHVLEHFDRLRTGEGTGRPACIAEGGRIEMAVRVQLTDETIGAAGEFFGNS